MSKRYEKPILTAAATVVGFWGARLVLTNQKLRGELVVSRAQVRYLEKQRAKDEELKAKIEEDASHDRLTGLLNERGLTKVYAHKKANHGRQLDDDPLLVAMIDLDRFKSINDHEDGGHDVGDMVLRHVAHNLSSTLRTDSGDVVGRLHGDEFVAFLHHVTVDESVIVAERMRQNVEALEIPSPMGIIRPTVTIGLAEVDWSQAGSFEEMYKGADQAMFIAKQGGRNQVHTL